MNTEKVREFALSLNREITRHYRGTIFTVRPDYITLKTFELEPVNPYLKRNLQATIRVSGKTDMLCLYVSGKDGHRLLLSCKDTEFFTSLAMKTLESNGFFKYLDYAILVSSVEDELIAYRKRLNQMSSMMLKNNQKLLANG